MPSTLLHSLGTAVANPQARFEPPFLEFIYTHMLINHSYSSYARDYVIEMALFIHLLIF